MKIEKKGRTLSRTSDEINVAKSEVYHDEKERKTKSERGRERERKKDRVRGKGREERRRVPPRALGHPCR